MGFKETYNDWIIAIVSEDLGLNEMELGELEDILAEF